MAISGVRMPAQRMCSSKHRGATPWYKRLICAVLGFSVVIMAGCMPTLRFGSLPKTEKLASLKAGVSSTSDVLLALGEPRGLGNVRISPILPPRQIWFYEFTEAEGKLIRLKLLLVFLDKERYDGYLWFSSEQLVEKAE